MQTPKVKGSKFIGSGPLGSMYTWRLGTSYIVTCGDIHTCCVATVLVGSAVVFVLPAIVV